MKAVLLRCVLWLGLLLHLTGWVNMESTQSPLQQLDACLGDPRIYNYIQQNILQSIARQKKIFGSYCSSVLCCTNWKRKLFCLDGNGDIRLLIGSDTGWLFRLLLTYLAWLWSSPCWLWCQSKHGLWPRFSTRAANWETTPIFLLRPRRLVCQICMYNVYAMRSLDCSPRVVSLDCCYWSV